MKINKGKKFSQCKIIWLYIVSVIYMGFPVKYIRYPYFRVSWLSIVHDDFQFCKTPKLFSFSPGAAGTPGCRPLLYTTQIEQEV
jgi:hypothetical protein